MKLLKEIPEAEMVAAFLKAELTSVRFSDELKKSIWSLAVDEAVIVKPDILDEQENALRAKVLGDYRGYRQNRGIFKDFPDKLTWYEAEISRDEIGTLHYIDYSYWNELTDHTHLVKDAVANIQKGKVVFNVSNDRFLVVAKDICEGQYDFEPIILWGKGIDLPFTILEGHLRATAFGIADEKVPEVIKVIVGISSIKR